ncbi:hypothetical protein FOMPIDRAFT_158448, partial [Fomitopsis schrenkii]
MHVISPWLARSGLTCLTYYQHGHALAHCALCACETRAVLLPPVQVLSRGPRCVEGGERALRMARRASTLAHRASRAHCGKWGGNDHDSEEHAQRISSISR